MKFMKPRSNSQETEVDPDYNITHIYSSVRSSGYRSSLNKSNSTEQTVASISSSEYEVPVTTSTGTSASEESYDRPSPPYLKLSLWD